MTPTDLPTPGEFARLTELRDSLRLQLEAVEEQRFQVIAVWMREAREHAAAMRAEANEGGAA